MLNILILTHLAFAQDQLSQQIVDARASISAGEKEQREALSHLFMINKTIKDMSKKRSRLNQKMLEREGLVREMAQEVKDLENKCENRKTNLNQRLRKLYQDRHQDSMRWLFSANSPAEFDRNQRYMRKIIDSDHRLLKGYLSHLKELKSKREQLKVRVVGLAKSQNELEQQETALTRQIKEKARLIAELKQRKDLKLSELKGLRDQNGPGFLSYAFFERKGVLRSPVLAPILREYGTYVDSQFRFKIMHKGLFYKLEKGSEVFAVAEGNVAFASQLPGYGKAIIIDHGDNYYSVYGFNQQLRVREGTKVMEGDIIATSGEASPLFGAGLYFEIRHFTDAIDPRDWTKDKLIKTANNHKESI